MTSGCKKWYQADSSGACRTCDTRSGQVCGDDNHTYDHECQAYAYGRKYAARGACGAPSLQAVIIECLLSGCGAAACRDAVY